MRIPSNSPPVHELLARAAALLGDANAPKRERAERLTALLRSNLGAQVRAQLGAFIFDGMRVGALVPDAYERWRPMVQDALRFILMRISEARLAPKLIEQFELPPDTRSETRLLRFIARMPGFQKLGQVLARNRQLHPSVRAALSELENGIHDADTAELFALVRRQLGGSLQSYGVEIEPELCSEATVSAVLRFTWRDPASAQTERGVFKVMKPHVPACFAEDIELLQQLAEYLESRHGEYCIAANVLLDTFGDVRRLLQHEVDFAQEQSTLRKAHEMYRAVPGVRTPRLIAPLCRPQITAMSEEPGSKITEAAAEMPAWRRQLVAAQAVECLIGVPLFARGRSTIFHADPHAGNLFYDPRSGEIVILDWALTEELSYAQRRHIAMLSILLALRDAAGVRREIEALSEAESNGREQEQIILRGVARFLAQLSRTALPGLMDVIRLLDGLALEGVAFPPSLLMFRKVLFTLDGVLHEIAGPRFSIDLALARCLLRRWAAGWPALELPLVPSDWLAVQWSAMFYGSRLWAESMNAF